MLIDTQRQRPGRGELARSRNVWVGIGVLSQGGLQEAIDAGLWCYRSRQAGA